MGVCIVVKLQSLVAKCSKCEKYDPVIVYKVCKFCILLYYVRKIDAVFSMVDQFSVRNTKAYKICKFCRHIFFAFHNILQPNLTILLTLGCSLMLW